MTLILLSGVVAAYSSSVAATTAATTTVIAASNSARIDRLQDENCIEENLPIVSCTWERERTCEWRCAYNGEVLVATIDYDDGSYTLDHYTWEELEAKEKREKRTVAVVIIIIILVFLLAIILSEF